MSRGTAPADRLDDELRYLSDLDAVRLPRGYALFRVIVWAIPILGFLGTVIGITMALNSVDLQAPDKSMLQVLNGLGLEVRHHRPGIDAIYGVDVCPFFRREGGSLAVGAGWTAALQNELAGRFAAISAGAEGQLATAERMGQTMAQTTESLMRRQSRAISSGG